MSLGRQPMYPSDERDRRKALIESNNTCARCGHVAWSLQLEAAMELRQTRRDPRKTEIVCGSCAEKAEQKPRRRGRAA